MVKKSAIVQINQGLFSLFHQAYIHPINTSKLFAGILMILMNVGSKYIDIGLSKTQEHALRNGLGREILIFCVVFLGTRDLLLSILMTSAFIILSDHIFNEKSQFCIIPEKMKHIASLVDTNNDSNISPEEIRKAKDILERAKSGEGKSQQGHFVRYMNNYNGMLDTGTMESFTNVNEYTSVNGRTSPANISPVDASPANASPANTSPANASPANANASPANANANARQANNGIEYMEV